MSAPKAVTSRSRAGGAAAILVLLLAACSSAASSSPATSSIPSMSMAASVGATAKVSTAPSPSGPIRCAVTPDAIPSATIEVTGSEALLSFAFSDPVTIKAGQAVAFTNGNGSPHTVTEGIFGKPVANACVDEPLGIDTTLIVTFYLPGVYDITCRPHAPMHTSVTVQ